MKQSIMTEEKKTEISGRIKELRKFHQMTQPEFAEKIGVAKTSVCEYENGNRTPHENTLYRICNYFGVTMQWLLYGHGEMYSAKDEDEIPNPEPELKKSVTEKTDVIRKEISKALGISIVETNELIDIARNTEDASYFRKFIKAIKGDEQAKKELMRKLLSE